MLNCGCNDVRSFENRSECSQDTQDDRLGTAAGEDDLVTASSQECLHYFSGILKELSGQNSVLVPAGGVANLFLRTIPRFLCARAQRGARGVVEIYAIVNARESECHRPVLRFDSSSPTASPVPLRVAQRAVARA